MNAARREDLLVRTCREDLLAANGRVVPPHEAPVGDGLAAWMDALADLTPGADAALEVALVAVRAWGADVRGAPHADSVSRRFREATLAPPQRWIRAYRAAALGALLHRGADLETAARSVGLYGANNAHRTFAVALRRTALAALTPGALAEQVRRAPGPAHQLRRAAGPARGFDVFVAPLVPSRAHPAWLHLAPRGRTPAKETR